MTINTRNLNPVNNISDKEINERLLIFSSLISIFAGKNLKASNILYLIINDKEVLNFLSRILEIDDNRKALIEFLKSSDKVKKPINNLNGNRQRKRKRNLQQLSKDKSREEGGTLSLPQAVE